MMFLLIVTLTSMLLAAIMSVIAWRMAGDEQRRSEARIAALAAEIHEPAAVPPSMPARANLSPHVEASPRVEMRLRAETPRPVPAIARAMPRWDGDLELRPAASPELFVPRVTSSSRPIAVLAGGVLVFGAAVAIAIGAGGGFRRAPRASRPVTATAPAPLPLELVALGHERIGDQLTVRGIVRNPSSGAGMDRLSAVVLLFTPDGGFLESGRASIALPALQPGGESAFAVTLPRAADVGRYRVSFRTDDHVVPHLDRRHEG